MSRLTAKTWIEVSRSALRHNARALKKLVHPAEFIAVVKANAYGHGSREVVTALDDIADRWAVDSLDEALTARRAGSKKPVIILGYTPPGRRAEVVRHGFSQTVYDLATLRQHARLASPRRPSKIHLKIETGTSRQGLWPADLAAFLRVFERSPQLRLEGIHTHFANAEDATDSSYLCEQLARFREATDLIIAAGWQPPLIHTACSAAAIMYPETRFTAVRVGLALYGLWPSPETRRRTASLHPKLKLKPALSWKTTVAQVKKLPAKTPIGYDLTERVRRPTTIAVLPVGYYDGLDRGLSSVGEVLVNGRRSRILGRICMNMCMIDVTKAGPVKAGDVVTLLGRDGHQTVSVEELADRANTINYEIVARLNPLLPRRMTR